jgi:two-component system response regulator GlrR
MGVENDTYAPNGTAVIIVEDDADMRALLRDALSAEGLPVSEEPDGVSLVERLEREPPALVVLDKEMPGPNGLDLLAYVTRRHPSLPVILITAFGGVPVAAEAQRLGATAYIEKPFGLARFVTAVRELLAASPR